MENQPPFSSDPDPTTPPPSGGAPGGAQTPEPTVPPEKDARTLAMLAHLLGVFGFLGPLIIWLIKKDESPFVDDQGKEALNFHLTLLIGHVIGMVLICITFGLLNLLVWVLGVVFSIVGAVAANQGQTYRYPFSIRMIK